MKNSLVNMAGKFSPWKRVNRIRGITRNLHSSMPFLKKFKICPEWKKKEQLSYKSGSRHTVYFLNGDKHVGDWQDNLKAGKGAELTRSGYLYEGDFQDELRHGHGVLAKQQPDGSLRLVYNGDWAHGKRHGWGIQRGADGSWYEGGWREGKRHGEGRAWLADNTFYHGKWLDGRFHGQGILVQPNGNRYEGEFENGLKHGRGCFYHVDNGQLQEGVWDQDVCVSSTVRDLDRAEERQEPSAELGNKTSKTQTIPPNELLEPDAVAAESQEGALRRVRTRSALDNTATR